MALPCPMRKYQRRRFWSTYGSVLEQLGETTETTCGLFRELFLESPFVWLWLGTYSDFSILRVLLLHNQSGIRGCIRVFWGV